MEQKLSSETPKINIDRQGFLELKTQIKNAEGALCLNIINKGLDQFDDFTEKQQQTFLKLAVDKLGLGKWKELKKKPTKELLNLIKSEINNEYKDRKTQQMLHEMYNELKEHSSINSIQEHIHESIPMYSINGDHIYTDHSFPITKERNTDTQETLDEKEVEKVYQESIKKLQQAFPEINFNQILKLPNGFINFSSNNPEEDSMLDIVKECISINNSGHDLSLYHGFQEWGVSGDNPETSLQAIQQQVDYIIQHKDSYHISTTLNPYHVEE